MRRNSKNNSQNVQNEENNSQNIEIEQKRIREANNVDATTLRWV